MKERAVEGERYLGLDIGSTTVKAVLIDATVEHVAEPVCVRSMGRPLEVVAKALDDLAGQFAGEVGVGITGSGREAVRAALGLGDECTVTEIYAHACGGRHVRPDVRSIVDIGGQDSKIIRIAGEGAAGFRIEDFMMNDLCAAGTGSFLEMHAKELGHATMDEFGCAAVGAGRASRIAARCSVLAQSDIVHLRQSGESADEMAAGLCRAIVINVLALAGGRKLEAPVLFQGGVAANAGVVKALRKELGYDEARVIVPEHHAVIGAWGAALNAMRKGCVIVELSALAQAAAESAEKMRTMTVGSLAPLRAGLEQTHPPLARTPPGRGVAAMLASRPDSICERTHPLPADAGRPLPGGDLSGGAVAGEVPFAEVVMGFDVGSASVKIAALNPAGHCVFRHYALHEGHPVEALRQGLSSFREASPEAVVKAVAVTGSGRDTVELRLGADVNVDEITAQASAARRLDSGIDAIFEIGGQDSKYIRLKEGQVDDFEMNRICAAGTGAFVMESARVLGVDPGEQLDRLVFASNRPAVLNHRCSVFAKSDMVSLMNSGTARCDVAAGVVYAIVKNYLTLVVGNRETGRRVLFLGGLARNSGAVRAALQHLRSDLEIVVPDGCEVSGALGAAEIALAEFKAGRITATRFRGAEENCVNAPVREFGCSGCTNECRVKQWKIAEGQNRFTGGLCGKYEDAEGVGVHGRNFAAEYLALLAGFEADKTAGGDAPVIGIPRALLYYEQGPMWVAFWRALGWRVELSAGGRNTLREGNRHAPGGEICLPVKALLGHVAQLREEGVRRIFIPTVVESRRREGAGRSDNCMLVQGAVDAFVRTAFPDMEVISPVFHYEGQRYVWRETLMEAALKLGANAERAELAIEEAEVALARFAAGKKELGESFMKNVRNGEPCAVLMGRPYSFAPELDMGIPRHLAREGLNVAPLLLLPALAGAALSDECSDLVFKTSQEMVIGSEFVGGQGSNVSPVIFQQFLCRQDSAVIPFLVDILGDRPCLQLMLDENSGDAGFRTRCAAFGRVAKNYAAGRGRATRTSHAFERFVPDRKARRECGTVWISQEVRFYSAGFESIGMKTRLLPHKDPDLVERGRKYFQRGEACLPFVLMAGALEKVKEDPEFDAERDILHVAGTRHCASTTLPHVMRGVCGKLGLGKLRIVSPRDGLDTTEASDHFGIQFARNLLRGLMGSEYLRKMMLSIRPYEMNAGQTDAVFAEALDDFYASFRKGEDFFRTLEELAGRLAAVPVDRTSKRPRILVTGEYVVRSDTVLNQEVHRRIEALGGETIGTPIFTDYVEMLALARHKEMWKNGRHAEAVRQWVVGKVCVHDIEKIRDIFRPHIPDQIEPNPVEYMEKRIDPYVCDKLDPVLLLEFYQTHWNVEKGDIAGIVNVHPFGCSVSCAVSPLIARHFQGQAPILNLSFDGQRGVHNENRLATFMECVGATQTQSGDDPDCPAGLESETDTTDVNLEPVADGAAALAE